MRIVHQGPGRRVWGILWRQLVDTTIQINPWSCRSTFYNNHLPGFLPYHLRTMVIAGETWQQGFRFCPCTVAKGAKCFRSVQRDIYSWLHTSNMWHWRQKLWPQGEDLLFVLAFFLNSCQNCAKLVIFNKKLIRERSGGQISTTVRPVEPHGQAHGTT